MPHGLSWESSHYLALSEQLVNPPIKPYGLRLVLFLLLFIIWWGSFLLPCILKNSMGTIPVLYLLFLTNYDNLYFYKSVLVSFSFSKLLALCCLWYIAKILWYCILHFLLYSLATYFLILDRYYQRFYSLLKNLKNQI